MDHTRRSLAPIQAGLLVPVRACRKAPTNSKKTGSRMEAAESKKTAIVGLKDI